MKIHDAATILAAGLAALAAKATAQTTLTTAHYGGHTYSLLSQSNWTAAEAKAISMGGHLATIDDEAENLWLFGAFSTYGGLRRNLWIGLNDAANEGDFVWASGESSGFRSWLPDQPDNDGGHENYVHILQPDFGTALWNDLPDVSDTVQFGNTRIGPMFGVVEVVPEPASLAVLGLGAATMLRRRRRR